MPPKASERRTETRYSFEATVQVKTLHDKKKGIELKGAVLENLGVGGVFIRTKRKIPEGTLADFSFKLPKTRKKLELLGLVRWHKPKEGVGIEFFYSTDEERQRVNAVVDSLADSNGS